MEQPQVASVFVNNAREKKQERKQEKPTISAEKAQNRKLEFLQRVQELGNDVSSQITYIKSWKNKENCNTDYNVVEIPRKDAMNKNKSKM